MGNGHIIHQKDDESSALANPAPRAPAPADLFPGFKELLAVEAKFGFGGHAASAASVVSGSPRVPEESTVAGSSVVDEASASVHETFSAGFTRFEGVLYHDL